MRKLLPHFIAEQMKNNIFYGNFNAITMFLDISGFTIITETLMKKGRTGSETMALIINNIFNPVTDTIYHSGGFISKFSGDAFYAVFMESEAIDVISCATKIKTILKKTGLQKTKLGDFEMSVKIGISSGNVEWGIIGDDTQKTFYFRGEAIDGCALSEHKCQKMDIIIDDTIYNAVKNTDILSEKVCSEYYRILQCNTEHKEVKITEQIIDEDILKCFFPEDIIKFKQIGEFREVIPVFISFDESIRGPEFNTMIESILKQCRDFGGYFKEIDYGDKGGIIVIIFGAPVCYEDNNKRAIDFITRVSHEFNDRIKAGITRGIAFAGFIGSVYRCDYAALSDTVNQAARFMAKAKWGEIWISKEINVSVKKYYNTSYAGRMRFKGKSMLIPVYRLAGLKILEAPIYYKGSMVGRKSELKTLSYYARKIYIGKFGGVVTVYGEPGIGKSRLAYEFIKKHKNAKTLYLKTDNILKTPYNPLKYCLKNLFGQVDSERSKCFDSSFNELIKKISGIDDPRKNKILKELKRTKSFIAAQMDIYYKDSLYEKLDAFGVYENTLTAYKELFKGLGLVKPLIIRIEDIHWLDDASNDVFNALCRGIDDYPIIIICTSRIRTDGSLPKLKLETNIPQYAVILNKLENENVKRFIETNFINNISPSLLDLIIKRTENNPFYIEQLILFMKENRMLKEERGQIYPVSKNIIIPQTISSVIISRIDRLHTSLKEIIRVSSVLGREGELKILKSIIKMLETGHFINDLDAKFIMLENENIWIKMAEIKYIFKHALIHQITYEMQLESTLIELHGLAAKKLEEKYSQQKDRLYEIANHYEKAKNLEKAITYFDKAQSHFKYTYQNKQALECIDVLQKLTNDKNRLLRYSYLKCQIHELLGNTNIGIEIAEKALSESIDHKYHEHSAWLQNQLAVFSFQKNDYAKALLQAKKAEDLATKIKDPNLLAYVFGTLGLIHAGKFDYKKAMQYYKKQEKICRKTDHKMFIGNANGNMATIYMHSGNYKKSMECLQISEKMFSAIDDKAGLSSNYGNIAIIHYNQGDYDKAMEYLEKQKQIYEEIGDKLNLARTIDNIASVYADSGNYKKAIHYLDLERQIYEDIDNKHQISLLDLNYARIYSEQGFFTKAEQYFSKSKAFIEAVGNIRSLSILHTELGNMYKMRKSYKKALNCYSKALEYAERLGHQHEISLISYLKADLLFILKDYENSHVLLKRSIKIAQKSGFKDTLDKIALLECKLISVESPKEAVQRLAELARDKTGELLAYIHYEIWRINHSKENREKALNLFKSLFLKFNKYIYQKIIEDINK